MKKKSFILTILLLVIMVVTLAGCSKNDGTFSFTLSKNQVDIILGEETGPDGEINTARVVATVDNTNNSTLTYRVINEGVVSAAKGRETGNQIEFIITGLMPGTAKVVIFSAENSGIFQEVVVNVYQHIEQVAFGDEFKMYVPIGSKMAIKPDVDLNIVPINSTKNDLRYEITSNNNLGVLIGETTGVIDATNAVMPGEIEIKVWSAYNPDSFSFAKVHIIENIQASEINISQSGTVTNNVVQAGKLNVEYIKLVKTKEFFSSTTLTLALSNHMIDQVEVKTSVDNYKILDIQKTSSNTFEVKAKELGLTNIYFSINLIGASDYIESTVIVVPVYVIDAPSNINVNGTMVVDTIDLDVYNNYSDSVKGALLRFTLLPSSVLLENSDISLSFLNGVGITEIEIYDSSMNKIDMTANKTIIKAGETLYLRADNVRVGEYTLVAIAEDTRNYEPYEELVSIQVKLKVKEGISGFAFADNVPFYVEKGKSKIITLAITPDYADMSSVNFGSGYNNFKVTKLTDYTYEITGLEVGDENIVFYRANGDPISALVKVYTPLTELSLDVDSPYINPVVGKKEYNDNNELSKVYVAVGNKLDVNILYNQGATILDTEFESTKPLIVNNIKNTLYVEKEGVSRFTVTLTGYDSEVAGARHTLSKTIEVEGYKPISSLNLNVMNSSLYNHNKVGYFNVTNLSSLTLKASIYPQTATYSSSITWSITDKSDDGYISGSLSTTTGIETIFTAELFNRNSDTVIISATVKEFNRTYSQSCTVTVYEPINVDYIVLNNITNKTIYFDSRNGLNTKENAFTVSASAYPVNATNRNLRYMYKALDPQEGLAEPRFSVDATGKIIPLRAGEAYLIIGAEDSFTTATNPTIYQQIKVVVQDGQTVATAFHITNVDELRAIGTDQDTMSLYYIITKDIDLKNVANWEPIGLIKKISFTGYLSGLYVVGEGEEQVKIQSSIMNLSLSKEHLENVEAYFGLFYKVSSNRYMEIDPYDTAPKMGTINDLRITVSKFTVDCSKIENLINNAKFNVYAGILAGTYTVDSASVSLIESGNLMQDGYRLGINNVSIKLLSSMIYRTGKNNGYIGGLFGASNAIITNNTTNSIISGADIVVIDKITYVVPGYNTTQTYYPNYYVGGIVGSNKGYIYGYNSFVDDEIAGDVEYVSLYDTQGVDVLSSINSYNIAYDLNDYRKNTQSVNAVFGGIAGINEGLIIGCGVENSIYGMNSIGGIAGKNAGSISDCSVASLLRGKENIGGIVGYNTGNIEYCSFEMYEDGVKIGENAIAIIGNNYVGGIVGYSVKDDKSNNTPNIIYSYAKSYIERDFVIYDTADITKYKGDIVATDTVGASLYIGGLAGFISNTSIENCFTNFNINVSSTINAYVGYAIGYSESSTMANTYTYSKMFENGITGNSTLGAGDCSISKSYFATYQANGDCFSYTKPISEIVVYNQNTTTKYTSSNNLSNAFSSFSNEDWFKVGSATVTLHEDKYPILRYEKNSSYTLVPVVPTSIKIKAKDDSLKIGNNANEITLHLYYYTSSNIEDRLNIRQKNIYSVRDLINTIIEPLSGRVNRLLISCDDTSIIKVDNSGNIEVVGTGLARIKITSKLNRKVYGSFRVYVTHPITKFDLFASVNSDEGAPKLGSGANEVSELRIKLGDNWQIKPNTSSYVNVDGINYLVTTTRDGGIYYTLTMKNDLVSNYLKFENCDVNTFIDGDGNTVYFYNIDLAIQNIINTLNQIDSGNIKVSATPYINVKYIDENNHVQDTVKYLDNLTKNFGISVYVGATDIYLDGASETITNTNTEVSFKAIVETDFVEEELNVEISDGDNKLLYSKRIESSLNSLPNVVEDSKDVFDVKLALTNFNSAAPVEKKAEIVVSIKLKEAYMYISENKEYYITISPNSNSTLSTTYKIVFIPQEISRINLTNYSYGEKDYITFEYNPNEEASNNIVPGYFSLLQIDVYPYYSNYDYIEIVNSNLSFEQLLKNDSLSGYPYVNPADRIYLANGIRLVNQYYKDGELITGKNGVYYVSMYLSSSTLSGESLKVEVKAYRTINGKATVVASNVISLNAENAPGVTLMYLNDGVYETSKNNNQLYIPVGTSGTMRATVRDFKEDIKFSIKNALSLDGETYKYVSLEKMSNGTYTIDVLPSATIGDKVTIVASVTKTIAGITITNTDTLTFTIVDYLIKDIGFEYVTNNRMREVYGGVYPLRISFEKSTFVYDKTNLEIEQKIKDTLNMLSSTDYSTWYAYKSGANNSNVALGRYYESSLNPYFVAYTKSSGDKTLYVKGTKYDEIVTNQKRIMANIAYYFDSVTCAWVFDKLGYNVPSRAESNTFGLIKENRLYNGKFYNIINRVFELDFYNESSRDNAIKIYTVEDFMAIEAGMSYLLLNDLTLENYTPIDVDFAYLDGNNHTITINSFAPIDEESETSKNYGLFTQVYSDTIIENLHVKYAINHSNSSFYINAMPLNSVTFGGFCGTNNGTIYNSSVNFASDIPVGETYANDSKTDAGKDAMGNYIKHTKDKLDTSGEVAKGIVIQITLTPINESYVSSVIGGFAATNSGFITNCRVEDDMVIHGYGTMGSFVAENSGTIASSYSKARLNSYTTDNEISRVGGFVADNNGKISLSFMEGEFLKDITKSSGVYSYTQASNIASEISGVASIGGFVYENNGEITNSYANVKINSNSPTAGFVFNNSGTISNVYSTSIVRFNSKQDMAFVGLDALNNINNTGTIEYSYFLDGEYTGKENQPAVLVNIEGLNDNSVLSSFAFDVTNTGVLRENSINGVWILPTSSDSKTYGNLVDYFGHRNFSLYKPTLVSPNMISRGQKDEYGILKDVTLGSYKRPYVIYSAEEFNTYLTQGAAGNINDKWYVLANDITFNNTDLMIDTYRLTFAGRFEGNNMAINNIRLSYLNYNTTGNIDSMGMFKEFNGAVFMNADLNVTEVYGTKVVKVGTLAGVITRSKVYNIGVYGTVIAQAQNIIGGLAGLVQGSIISDIDIDIGVNAGLRNTGIILYDPNNEKSFASVSYAGAAIGFVLTDNTNDTTASISGLSGEKVGSYVHSVHVGGQTKIIGEMCGGVIGFIGIDSVVNLLDIKVTTDMYMRATTLSGGLVAENRGTIKNSYSQYIDADQKVIDTVDYGTSYMFANIEFFKFDTTDKIMSSKQITVGGLVGYNYNGSILNSFSKLNVHCENAMVAGGLVGRAYGGTISNAYASGYVYIGAYDAGAGTLRKIVGGIVGVVSSGYGSSLVKENPLKLTINNVIAINNWQVEHAYLLKKIVSDDPNQNGKVTTITGSIVGALHSTAFLNMNSSSTNYYNNMYAIKTGIKKEDELKVDNNIYTLYPIGAIRDVDYNEHTDEVGFIESNMSFGIGYDIFELYNDGVETFNKNFNVYVYDPWMRGKQVVEGRKTQVFSSLILNNFQFKDKDARYPVIRTNYAKLALSEMLQVMDNGSYALSQKYHFDLLAYFINDAQYKSFSGYSFEMVRDVDFASQPVSPIGGKNPFKGRFNGNGFAIKNLTISSTSYVNDGTNYLYGLFGKTNGASIRNFGLDSSCTINVQTAGSAYVGIIGYAINTDISGVYSYAIYKAYFIQKNCSIGGIVGFNKGDNKVNTISNCYVDSTEFTVTYLSTITWETSSYIYAGGIIGNSVISNRGYSIITNCYTDILINLQDKVCYSGIANLNATDQVYNCWTSFTFSAGTTGNSNNRFAISNQDKQFNCYVFTNVNTGSYNPKKAANIPHNQLTNRNWYINMSYWNSNYVWDFDELNGVWVANENKYPTLRNTTTINTSNSIYAGIGEYDKYSKYYIVRTEQNLRNLASMIESGEIVGGGSDIVLVLANDITLTDWTLPIGTFKNPFRGQFYGLGYTITITSTQYLDIKKEKPGLNISVEEDYAYGLFGRLDNAIIKYVDIVYNAGVHITNKGQSTYIGGLAGLSRAGIIANCNVTINSQMTVSSADQFGYLGGLIGQADNQTLRNNIVYLSSTAKLVGDYSKDGDNSYSVRVGGLVGYVKKQQLYVFDNAVIFTNTNNIAQSSNGSGVFGLLFGYVRENDSVSTICGNHVGVTDDLTFIYGLAGIGSVYVQQSDDEKRPDNTLLTKQETLGTGDGVVSNMFENDIWLNMSNWIVDADDDVFINIKGSKEEFVLYKERIRITGSIVNNIVSYKPDVEISNTDLGAQDNTLYDYVDLNQDYVATYDEDENELYVVFDNMANRNIRNIEYTTPANGFEYSLKVKFDSVFESSSDTNRTIWHFKNTSTTYLALQLLSKDTIINIGGSNKTVPKNSLVFSVGTISGTTITKTTQVVFKNGSDFFGAKVGVIYNINIRLYDGNINASITYSTGDSATTYVGSVAHSININTTTSANLSAYDSNDWVTGLVTIRNITSTTGDKEIATFNGEKFVIAPTSVDNNHYSLSIYYGNSRKEVMNFPDLKLSKSTTISSIEVTYRFSSNCIFATIELTVDGANYTYVGEIANVKSTNKNKSVTTYNENKTLLTEKVGDYTFKVEVRTDGYIYLTINNLETLKYKLNTARTYTFNLFINENGFATMELFETHKSDISFERYLDGNMSVFNYSFGFTHKQNGKETIYDVEGFGNTIPVIRLED